MLHSPEASVSAISSHHELTGSSGPNMASLAIGFLRRQYLLIAVATAVGLAGSIAFLKVAPATYTAQVTILLQNSKAPLIQPQTQTNDTPFGMASQIEILKSTAIATSVIRQLNLTNDPEFTGRGGWLQNVSNALRGPSQAAPEAEAVSLDEIVEDFENRMTAGRVGMSNVVAITFSASRPERASVIANAIVKAYFEDQLQAKTEEQHTATNWLHDRLQELSGDATRA